MGFVELYLQVLVSYTTGIVILNVSKVVLEI